MRFVTRQIHAWLDYPVALSLMVLPFVLGLGASHDLAGIVAPIVGLAALILTVLTDHETGLLRVLPYKLHLAVDLSVGVLFLILPLVAGFTGLDAAYYLLNGAAVVAVIGLSSPETVQASA